MVLMRKTTDVRKLVIVAMMAALSYLLIFFQFPILPGVSFLQIDFGDLPVFISMFLYGPAAGAATSFISCLLDFITKGQGVPGLIGDIGSFLAAMCFTLPVYYFFKRKTPNGLPSLKNRLLGFTTGILLMIVFMSLANVFVLLPMYLKFSGFQINGTVLKMVFTMIVPFNLIKGILVSIVFSIAYAKLLPWLSRKVLPKQTKHVY
jgi:riboflavin transporter FmnP